MLNSGGVAEKPGGGVLSLNIAWMYNKVMEAYLPAWFW